MNLTQRMHGRGPWGFQVPPVKDGVCGCWDPTQVSPPPPSCNGAKLALPRLSMTAPPVSSTYLEILCIYFLPETELCLGLYLHYFIFKSKEQMLESKILGNIWNPTQHISINWVMSSLKYKLSFPKVGRVCTSRQQSAVPFWLTLLAGAVSAPLGWRCL